MHPVKKFIENDLEMSTNSFAKFVGKNQSTVASFYTRNTSIANLPVWLVCGLSDVNNSSIESVISTLKKYGA